MLGVLVKPFIAVLVLYSSSAGVVAVVQVQVLY